MNCPKCNHRVKEPVEQCPKCGLGTGEYIFDGIMEGRLK